MNFQTSPKINNWTKMHKENGCKSKAAAGEQFQYLFIPSGIVECQIVECLVCGEKCQDYVE